MRKAYFNSNDIASLFIVPLSQLACFPQDFDLIVVAIQIIYVLALCSILTASIGISLLLLQHGMLAPKPSPLTPLAKLL